MRDDAKIICGIATSMDDTTPAHLYVYPSYCLRELFWCRVPPHHFMLNSRSAQPAWQFLWLEIDSQTEMNKGHY